MRHAGSWLREYEHDIALLRLMPDGCRFAGICIWAAKKKYDRWCRIQGTSSVPGLYSTRLGACVSSRSAAASIKGWKNKNDAWACVVTIASYFQPSFLGQISHPHLWALHWGTSFWLLLIARLSIPLTYLQIHFTPHWLKQRWNDSRTPLAHRHLSTYGIW